MMDHHAQPSTLGFLPPQFSSPPAECQPQGVQPHSFPLQGVVPHGFQPQGVVNHGSQPQGVMPHGFQPQGVVPNGFQPQGVMPHGFQPQGVVPNGFQPQGVMPHEFQPQGVVPSGFQPQGVAQHGFQPQGVQQGLQPQGVIPHGFQPQGVVPHNFHGLHWQPYSTQTHGFHPPSAFLDPTQFYNNAPSLQQQQFMSEPFLRPPGPLHAHQQQMYMQHHVQPMQHYVPPMQHQPMQSHVQPMQDHAQPMQYHVHFTQLQQTYQDLDQPIGLMHNLHQSTPPVIEKSIENRSLPTQTIHQEGLITLPPTSSQEAPPPNCSTDHVHDLQETNQPPRARPKRAKPKKTRPRKPRTAQLRRDIIFYKERNPGKSMKEIAKEFKDINRTTINGIIQEGDDFVDKAWSRVCRGLTLQKCYMMESPLRIHEELLVEWSSELVSRGVAVNIQSTVAHVFGIHQHKFRAQALELHRMLSRLLKKSPPCRFTSGWLQKFKGRHQELLKGNLIPIESMIRDDGWISLSKLQNDIVWSMKDVYICGITSMYLNMLPSSYDGAPHASAAGVQDSPIATILLCCNAAFTNRVKPLLSVRHNGGNSTETDLEDLTDLDVKGWLQKIDNELNGVRPRNNPIVLVMEPSVWRQVESLGSFAATLNNIILLKALAAPATSHPVAVGLAQEFKQRYIVRRLTRTGKPQLEDERPVDIAEYCADIDYTCNNIQGSTAARRSIDNILESLEGFLGTQPAPSVQNNSGLIVESGWPQKFQGSDNAGQFLGSNVTDAENEWDTFHIDRFPELIQTHFQGLSETVVRQYMAQDLDLGPSSFLRGKIWKMKDDDDVKDCFGPLNFGQVMRDIPSRSLASALVPNITPLSATNGQRRVRR
ncbi:hypothetical protein B0O80DRAFT_492270 [Mortierella sp. GBAus27b]|nr:hypothetical protein B0O80DRAFT_492270 [Mortierella sp. GBAus27b]